MRKDCSGENGASKLAFGFCDFSSAVCAAQSPNSRLPMGYDEVPLAKLPSKWRKPLAGSRGYPSKTSAEIRDLWAHKSLGRKAGGFSANRSLAWRRDGARHP